MPPINRERRKRTVYLIVLDCPDQFGGAVFEDFGGALYALAGYLELLGGGVAGISLLFR